ncbi:protein FAM162A isoform X2 [Egretta garzetta]|uniref:protein FAM162A isoform X2 n=1 Tax=Egretta garzetta TaxID=188379 RepID=UPI00163CE36A|nr:protein FAM162A isoform X2 [Egretta garzetta]
MWHFLHSIMFVPVVFLLALAFKKKKKPNNLKASLLTFYCSELDLAPLLPLLSLPDRAVKLLGRNIPSIQRMTKGMDLKINRRLCIKPQEESQHQPRSRSPLRVPGHRPTDWEKRFLLWAGNFKKPEDIPETVSIETIRAAKTTLRVKFSYVMIALTILGCIVMVIKGKQLVNY